MAPDTAAARAWNKAPEDRTPDEQALAEDYAGAAERDQVASQVTHGCPPCNDGDHATGEDGTCTCCGEPCDTPTMSVTL